MRHAFRTLAATVLGSALGACAQPPLNGTCNTAVQAFGTGSGQGNATGAPTPTQSESAGTGGYVTFGGKRCTALFRFRFDEKGAYGQVFTARHCGPDSPGAAETKNAQVTLDVFAGDGYYLDVPATEEYSARRDALLARADALAPTNAGAAALLRSLGTTTRFPERSMCALASEPINFRDENEPESDQPATYTSSQEAEKELSKRGTAYDSSCWMYAEVATYEVKVDAAVFARPENAGLKQMLEAAETKRRATQEGNVSRKALLDAYETDMLALTSRSRLTSHAFGLDFLRLCATPEAKSRLLYESAAVIPTLETYDSLKAACTARAQVKEALAPFLVERVWNANASQYKDLDLLAQAKTWGYDADEPALRTRGTTEEPAYLHLSDEVTVVYNLLVKEQGSRFNSLQAAWKMAPGEARVALNVGPKNAAPGSTGSMAFAQLELEAFNARKLSMVLDKSPLFLNAFRIFFAKEGALVSLSKGDSGSLLTVRGMLPVAALNGVGDDTTSGGASVVALPARQRSAGAAGDKAQNAENTNGKNQDAQGKRAGCNG